jgi:DNA modification methylase
MPHALLVQATSLALPLRDQSVHCIVTSPPYYGLRDYGTGQWEGGHTDCTHARCTSTQKTSFTTASRPTNMNHEREGWKGGRCGRCGAVSIDQQLGLERLHDCLGWATGTTCEDCYICAMRRVARECWRILRDDGTMWWNIGDSYASNWPCSRRNEIGAGSLPNGKREARAPRLGGALKNKDLCGIPSRLALALQADGWYWRSEIVWHKPNPMPESVTDRPTRSHEQVFLFSKQERYFYDAEAIREPHLRDWAGSCGPQNYKRDPHAREASTGLYRNGTSHQGIIDAVPYPAGRNARDVWTLAAEPTPFAHFATMPTALVERCIKAGTPLGGIVCDPFVGSGTTLLVARALGRSAIGTDLSFLYLHSIAHKRLGLADLAAWEGRRPLVHPTTTEGLPLFSFTTTEEMPHV